MENERTQSKSVLTKKRVIHCLWIILGIAASIRLIRAAQADSMDFHVYWKAAQTWIGQGISPYLYDASDRGFVFKYPPWILPFFFPFGFLSFEASKVTWALVGLFCIYFSIYQLIRQGMRPGVAFVSAALFWWIWLGHIYSGQFTLVLLAAAMWAVPTRSSPGKLAFLSIIFTTKVFSVISLLGRWRECFRLRPVVAGLALLLFLHLIVFGVFVLHGQSYGMVELYRQWVQAASSGGQELGAVVVRGQMNHGFTAGVLRAFHVDAHETSLDYKVALVLAALFSAIWVRASKGLKPVEVWAGWLGVGLICHPLAWHHSFVLAYPLCALSLDRAVSTRSTWLKALSVFGMVCIGILIPNVFGMTLVTPLEMISIKSWGVCFSALALVLATRSLSSQQPA
ncbi:MAG: glycosyltransferase 87 family protein [Bdellovibrionia bacterium]